MPLKRYWTRKYRPTELVVFCCVYASNLNNYTRAQRVFSELFAVWCMNKSDEYSNSNIFGILDKTDLYNDFNFIPTLRQTKSRERPETAICVRKSSARRVLHFTPLNAASCVLHRPANRVIHRLQLFCILYIFSYIWKHSNKAHSQTGCVCTI